MATSGLDVPAQLLTNNQLTAAAKRFLRTVFTLFSEDGNSLSNGGLMSILVLGYPDKELMELRKSVTTIFRMAHVQIDGQFEFEKLFEINRKGAVGDPEAFRQMCENLCGGYNKHFEAHAFLNDLSKLGLPGATVIEPLQLMFLAKKKSLEATQAPQESAAPTGETLFSLDMEGVLEKIDQANNIVVMAGAGMSTSCGIPDFRTPGTGLYDNLQQYNLPKPEAVFTLNYFKENPEPFWMLSQEISPKKYFPSPTHYFLKLLENKGKLKRHYTQNIDGLERFAGLSEDLIVEAHGSYNSGHCVECDKEYDSEAVFGWLNISDGSIPRCDACGGLVKPNITFFGEGLPPRFHETQQEDFAACDLLIVIGSSLVVSPFCDLRLKPTKTCPRVLINMEPAGEAVDGETAGFLNMFDPRFEEQSPQLWECYKELMSDLFGSGDGFTFPPNSKATRDVFLQGKCDETVFDLCDALGWRDELDEIILQNNIILSEQNGIPLPTVESTNITTEETKSP